VQGPALAGAAREASASAAQRDCVSNEHVILLGKQPKERPARETDPFYFFAT
jgi:hypothetical protein